MGKRSNYDRIERDFYPTPYEAVEPLIPFIEGCYFYEPCAGDGALVDHLIFNGIICSGSSDTEPQRVGMLKKNALDIKIDTKTTDCVITNPPWGRKEEHNFILHRIIDHFRVQVPTWLLFDADWMHTKQAREYLKYCPLIVSVGRIKWFPDSDSTGIYES